jgi:branched-chain amino acid transport system permease protein
MEANDRDVVYREYFRDKQRQYLRTLLCDDIIEEHRRNPRGQHSEPLERLLIYMRQSDQARYVVRRDARSGKFRVGWLTGQRSSPLELVDDAQYMTADEAYHAVFLRRLRHLIDSG